MLTVLDEYTREALCVAVRPQDECERCFGRTAPAADETWQARVYPF